MNQATSPIPQDAIREELDRVLSSHEFRTSKRSQDFLRYVVEHALAGGADHLKERTIGIEVFGRPTTYDPSEDATVRVKAGEVRKRLGLYYAGGGARDHVRIELPPGTYAPEFHIHDETRPNTAAEGALAGSGGVNGHAEGGTRRRSRFAQRAIWIAAGSLVAISGIAGGYRWVAPQLQRTALDEFWAPVVRGANPISVCAAFVPVYALNRDPAPAGTPRAEDFVHLTDQFVGGGDLVAVSRLSALLTRMKRPYRVKIGNAVTFEDLRTSPAILVGYSYTHWKQISQEMRYFIDTSRRPVGITDNGAATPWVLPHLPADRRTDQDYALVTRVFHPDTHAMLVEIAGITQYGTNAAADFVTSADLLGDALRGAPADWQHKNIQFVLHMKVISGTPSSPKVVARYIW